ncbi:hypothetical protein KC330_g6615 [Hortaea werneckii]|nr:hypothetical protein KC330_g6615 [Hortaea werneckii]
MVQSEEQTPESASSGLSSAQRHPPSYADKLFYRYHHHTVSDTTATSGSTDSSPTTTASTVDDSSATEPSPGSSPESPPPSSFSSMLRPRTSADSTSTSPFFELAKQPPPSRKGRNLKGLAVNTDRNPRAASTTSLPLRPAPERQMSAYDDRSLASPAFVKPPSPPKRKPSGLTLLTPGSSKAPPQEVTAAVPPTPALSRPATLRHFQSSPSLPIVPGFSSHSNVGPPGLRRGAPAPLETILSPIEQHKQEAQIKEDEQQNFDVPLSKEEKPQAYPDGPICVYTPGIDLYLEPTAEQCREYDVVMNVASEVRNPLVSQEDETTAEPELRIDGGGGIQYAPKHLQPTNASDDAADGSPTTPKATPLHSTFAAAAHSNPKRDPEYIHVPWEHNSDIVPDLLRLVRLIDEKVKQGKRVLVHCQCGVSRSASLVVAYGLYKDPTMSVQEAYDAVKARSKWIGPNMNLIMQLQEFRSSLARGGLLPGNRGYTPITPSSAYNGWRGPFAADPSDPISMNAPLSASVATKSQTATKEEVPAISPGPSSAPSGLHWPVPDQAEPSKGPQRERSSSAVKPASPYVDPAGHVVPVLNVVEPGASDDLQTAHATPDLSHDDQATPTEIASPRSAEFAMTPLQPPKDVESADSFGIMSPTTTEFASSPFDRSTLLASVGMGSMQPNDAPRRTLSSQTHPKTVTSNNASAPSQQHHAGLDVTQAPKLRGKISQPSLKEQQELQSLQAKIEASLHHRPAQPPDPSPGRGDMDEALMSPRATEFTHNPFSFEITSPPEEQQKQGQDAPRIPDSDPRSPAHQGVSPITRNIMDVL